ncbi:MAG: RrF2 family transcriptional regulator [Candidatus Bipolaricaulia bacterium]
MTLTKRSDYGLRAALELAAHYDQGPLSAHRIAKRSGLPEPFVKKLLQQLVVANVARSLRGRGGGYVLEKRPDEISLREVLEAFEELAPVSCLRQIPSETAPCTVELVETDCPTRAAWKVVDRRVRVALETVTLADLLEEVRARSLTLERSTHA